jgi:predicted transcriptional regulator
MLQMEREGRSPSYLIEMVSDIVSAYVAHNPVPVADLPKLIEKVHGVLTEIETSGAADEKPDLKPAVPVRRSVTDDHIVCLEDGKKFKSLKRHLRTRYDMSPDEYREKWGLPQDYPMVAPNYARQRSDLARKMGLGQSRK